MITVKYQSMRRRVGMLCIRIELWARRIVATLLTHTLEPLVSAQPRRRRTTIAFNIHPVLTSWGGGNQWLLQFSRFLASQGYLVSFSLQRPVDLIIIVDPNSTNQNFCFGLDEIRKAKQIDADLVCLHRINECDQRKGTSSVDKLMSEANQLADYTVFVSGWLRDHHAGNWFDRSRAHTVILNGADPSVFKPASNTRSPGENCNFRIVTHHWSDNWNKGFHEYREIDRAITQGRLKGCELWIIGRWPRELEWSSAKTFGPHQGQVLAALLKQCDIYITASRWEPGAMHYVEGAQCGLPVVYQVDTGGAPEVVSEFGVAFQDDPVPAVEELMSKYAKLREQCLIRMPSGDVMCRQYFSVVSKLLAAAPALELRRPGRTPQAGQANT